MKIWVDEVLEIASRHMQREVHLKELPDLFVMNSADDKKFVSLAQLKSLPSAATINAVAAAHPRESNARIFAHTKELFEIGMHGFPLWRILDGDLDVCLKIVDEEITYLQGGVAPDENSSFEKRVRTIFVNRLPTSIDGEALWRAISEDLSHDIHVEFNVIALTAEDADEIPCKNESGEIIADPTFLGSSNGTWHKKETIVRLNAGQAVTNIALYVLSKNKKELVAQCHYMLKGVLHKVIREQFNYGSLLSDFLTGDDWQYGRLI